MSCLHKGFLRAALATAFSALLVSCGGGGASGGASSPAILPGGLSPGAARSAGQIFVPNDLGIIGSVTVYPASANGNVAPAAAVAGPNTQLGPATGVAFDSAGDLYVANKGVGCITSCIAEFAPGASGNVAPIRTICGSNTMLSGQLGGIALDAAGNIYVADPPESVVVFSASASGNASPTRVITGPATGLAVPTGIAVDAAARVYVANKAGSTGAGSITIYAAGASGNAAPAATIAGPQTGIFEPTSLALDSSKNIYETNVVTSQALAPVLVFPATANGNAFPSRRIGGGLTAASGIALDSAGNIYLAGVSSVSIFAAGASDNAAPLRIITGSNTQLSSPGRLAVR